MVSEQRYKRTLEAELGLDQPEGSGTDQSFFNGTGKSYRPVHPEASSAPHAASLSFSQRPVKRLLTRGPALGRSSITSTTPPP